MPSRPSKLLRYVAANVRNLRLRKNLTQEALAERADLDLNSIRRVETARTNLSLSTLDQLAEALDVDAAALLRSAILPKPRRGRPRRTR